MTAAPLQLLVAALVAAYWPDSQREIVPDGGPVRQLYVRLSPAESLQVTVAGHGEPVVLIPGLFGSAFSYRHLLARLPEAGYQAIVIEPLGIGTSARPEKSDYSLTSRADRIATVMHRMAPGPAILVAHSTGASMALRLAYRRPELVKAVVSLDGGPAEAATSRGFRRAMQYVPWIKWMGGAKKVRGKIRDNLIATSGDTTWVTEEVVDAYTAGARADLDGTLKAYLSMSEAREPERLIPRLGEVRCPVRLVLGTARHDGGIPDRQLGALRRGLASFAIDSVPGAGLHVYEEQPQAIVEAIRRASREVALRP
ncbi:MAG TPA: alpha/beta hydrolase [Actinomycetota bacterium]|nr:alpha/beta hydrolase [Actinomycetota bacterium]